MVKINKSLERIFSEENLLDYGRACIDVALAMSSRNLDALLIPSRGAFPIFLGSVEALKYLGKEYDEYEIAHRKLNPAIPVNGWLDKYLPIEDRISEEPVNVLFTPFTADLNLRDDSVDDLEIIAEVRDYWSKVTSAFFLPPEERYLNPYFKSFTDIVLGYIEGRDALAEKYKSFPQIKNMGIIDTVISGRASSTILDCMDDLHLNPYSILVVDSNGEKLQTPFKQKLEARLWENKAKFVKTNNILSEDEGAALEGVIALVYPGVMIKSLDLGKFYQRNFIYGAGSWHYPSESEKVYSYNFNLFMNAVNNAIAIHVFDSYCSSDGVDYLSRFKASRVSLLKNMSIHNFSKIRESSVSPFNLNPDLKVNDAYETSSHVLHVPFDDKSTEGIIERLAVDVLGIEYDNPYNH